MMETNFARHHFIGEVAQLFYIDHDECKGLTDNIMGCFAAALDTYQLDELEKNGYTYIQACCLYCYEDSDFIVSTKVSR